MVIQELKPSKRVEGRWLAVLEGGSILRVGEGEVVDFALYAGKELSDEEAERLQAAACRGEWKRRAIELLMRKPQSRKELGRKLREWNKEEIRKLGTGIPLVPEKAQTYLTMETWYRTTWQKERLPWLRRRARPEAMHPKCRSHSR